MNRKWSQAHPTISTNHNEQSTLTSTHWT